MSRPVGTPETRDAGGIEVERYRHAAEASLDQLEWCINLLYKIGKPRIAQAVDTNYQSIRRRVREIAS
jgi:hypothetical protein